MSLGDSLDRRLEDVEVDRCRRKAEIKVEAGINVGHIEGRITKDTDIASLILS